MVTKFTVAIFPAPLDGHNLDLVHKKQSDVKSTSATILKPLLHSSIGYPFQNTDVKNKIGELNCKCYLWRTVLTFSLNGNPN